MLPPLLPPSPRTLSQHLAGFVLLLMATIALTLSSPASAQASIHTYAESTTQTLYRSQHSIRDDRDHAWQAIFLKRQEGNRVTALHLRLVGYPGIGYPSQSRNLEVITGPEAVWEFPNVSSQEPNLTENASQFDLSSFIRSEARNLPLKLYLPIRNVRHPSVLTVPPFMVQEWHQVAQLSQPLSPTPDSRTAERTPNPNADRYPV